MFLAANDVSNFHQGIIDDAGKIVGRETIAFDDDKIADFGGGETNLASNDVVNNYIFTLRDGKTDGNGFAFGAGLFDIGFIRHNFRPAINKRRLFRFGFLAHRIEFFGGIEAVVGEA